MTILAQILVGVSLGLVVLVFVVYPLLLVLVAVLTPRAPPRASEDPPSISMIVAFRGGGGLIQRKIENFLDLDYPCERLELVLVADGPAPDLEAVAAEYADPRIQAVEMPEGRGKALALNHAMQIAHGDVLLFSDLDARLATDCVQLLAHWFTDPDVGGVCGRRVLDRDAGTARAGQSGYIEVDSLIKQGENRLGAITSSDGKCYAVRRELAGPIDASATDDLYNALTVILAGKRYLFESQAQAHIRTPSRSSKHEVERRRRVVVRSLSGMFARPRVFGLLRFGLFGPRLVVNKVCRRLLPLALVGLLIGTAMLASTASWAGWATTMQVLFYAASGLYGPVESAGWLPWLPRSLRRLWQLAFYFCVGMWGMLLGIVEFARGKRIARWEPRKA